MAKAFSTSSKECGGQCKVNGLPTQKWLCQKLINIRADSLAQRGSTAQTSRLHSSKLRAVSSPVSADATVTAGPRPPCYQEVWIPPSPSQLIKDKRAFLEEHRIRGYEVGPDQKASIITIANLLQEVASNHAVAMWGRSSEGFATDPQLVEAGLIFVMTRMQIQMDKYPRWGDVVEFETWFQEAGKLGAQRDWIMRDKMTGREIGRATSTWVMINMRTRRLCKLPEEVRLRCAWYQLQPPANAIASEYTRLKIPEVSPESAIVGPAQVARKSDTDMNGHINNVIYLGWAVETTEPDVRDNCHLYQVEIDFKAECHSGDVVDSWGQRTTPPAVLAANGAGPDALSFLHTLRRREGEGGTELVRARTTWRAGEAV